MPEEFLSYKQLLKITGDRMNEVVKEHDDNDIPFYLIIPVPLYTISSYLI